MNKNYAFNRLALNLVILVALAGPQVFASPTLPPSYVTIDVSGLVGKDISLDFSLYDNSGVVGDSWAVIDNVAINGMVVDFEDGTLRGFDDSLNPDSVEVVPGTIWGAGSKVMRIDEDLLVTPTVTYRDYLSSGATSLSFELEMTTSETVGPWGLDELVVSIYNYTDAIWAIPDALVVNADGAFTSAETSITIIPAPGAAVLAMIGIGCVGLVRRWRAGERIRKT